MGIIWTDDTEVSQYPFDARVPRKLVIKRDRGTR